MSDESPTDDQSHYEISLTAGQAFVAFVLLLLSLASSFAFGLLIGRNQADDRLVVRKEPAVISEGSVVPKKNAGKIVELGVTNDAFKPAPTTTAPTTTTLEEAASGGRPPAAKAGFSSPVPAKAATHAESSPAYAQLLSTTDQKTAEAMAAKLIEGGFSAAYVERTTTDKGATFRVRVKFPSEEEARAAEAKLKTFSKDVWITKQ